VRGYGRLVRERLAEAGCWFVRHGRGDHDVWASPHADKPLTVPVNIDSRHTANKVLKDAGLPKAF
jgi:hypothetical protein